MALSAHAKNQFEMMQHASAHGRIAIMEMVRRDTGANVAVICAVNREQDGGVSFVPIGEIDQNANPYMLYMQPDETDNMKVCPDCHGWQTIQSSLSLETEHLCHRCNGNGLIDPEMDGDAKANQVH